MRVVRRSVSTLPTFCSFPFANELELILFLSVFVSCYASRVTYRSVLNKRYAGNRLAQKSTTAERDARVRARRCVDSYVLKLDSTGTNTRTIPACLYE